MASAGEGDTPETTPRDEGADHGQPTKKRRTGANSRGVANLTPEQLARKRANDREAQRAIRERTKNQIDALNQRIRDLESQQPYNDLQIVLREKEAVQAENADIKKRLESVLAIIQPIVRATGGLNGTFRRHINDCGPKKKERLLTPRRTGSRRRTLAPSSCPRSAAAATATTAAASATST
jgi:hypothetical protein